MAIWLPPEKPKPPKKVKGAMPLTKSFCLKCQEENDRDVEKFQKEWDKSVVYCPTIDSLMQGLWVHNECKYLLEQTIRGQNSKMNLLVYEDGRQEIEFDFDI